MQCNAFFGVLLSTDLEEEYVFLPYRLYLGVLLLTDLEEEYFADEIIKLHQDIFKNKLSVIVIGEWYNTEVMKKVQFFDENTRQWWIPETGGANVPALNDLMRSWGVAFTSKVYKGKIDIAGKKGLSFDIYCIICN